jgi:hypothetical protein
MTIDPVLGSVVVVQLVTFAALLVTQRQQRLREAQRRAWDVEDRAAVARIALTAHTQVLNRTEQAITAAHHAYQEANHVNTKIESLATAAQTGSPELLHALDALHKVMHEHDTWERQLQESKES